MTILQRALTPARVRGYLGLGVDQVAGYTVVAADVAWATTPATLIEAHGLGFPGTPFHPGAPSIEVLRFETPPFARLLEATGANSAEGRERTGGLLVDHPPFTGTGFAATPDHLVPLWWLDAARLPAGAEIWRVHSDGREELLAVYTDVSAGWSPVVAMTGQTHSLPSDVLGGFGSWRGSSCLVDTLPDGAAVVASFTEIPGSGMTLGPRGVWSRTVAAIELTEPHGVRLTAVWRGAPFLVTHRWRQDDGLWARLFFLGRDAFEAEALGLEKVDAGVYEASVPIDQLGDIRAAELTTA
ncbi:hypothetical protein [Compostimonas suwonensis]|uniref:Uncharacterized protein n=1 Tax=Compostimonas suwonensis TaxID=1048394 RepID=A0A2M9BVW8_9MICO|nr:hypothetical protein [Compostimonas suwonensis]PJJ62098.1 hypothetical protein CLV54_1891 [Compostimonas suwonensis]